MPRSARLDAPGALYHIIIRGIERRQIFKDNNDREDFPARLEKLLARDKDILLRMGTYSQSFPFSFSNRQRTNRHTDEKAPYRLRCLFQSPRPLHNSSIVIASEAKQSHNALISHEIAASLCSSQ